MRYKILVLLLVSLIFIGGCAWFSEGIINVFDPKAQIRVSSYTINPPQEGEIAPTFTATLVSLNDVGARFGTIIYEFSLKVGGSSVSIIPELTKVYGINLSLSPGTGNTLELSSIPLYFQEELDYLHAHPENQELLLTLWIKGTDEADHKIEVELLRDYPITITQISVSNLTISANPSTLSPGDKSTITVQALDANGNPVKNATIYLSVSSGTLENTSLVTDESGYASTVFTAGSTIGTVEIVAISGSAEAQIEVEVISGQPSTLTITANPSTLSPGEGSIISVQVLDSNGVPVSGAEVTLTTSGGTLGETSLTTDTSGYATTTLDTTGTSSGDEITVTAASGGAVGSVVIQVQ